MGSVGLGDNKEMADLANQRDVSTTGGGAGSAIFSKEQSDEIRRKAGEGRVIGMDDLNPQRYLGHFAKDEVAEEGHNSGAPKQHEIKRLYGGETAKRGYKVIPGNVTDGYTNKKVREAVANATTVSTRYGGPIPAFGYGPPMEPPTKAPLRKRAREAKRAAGPGKGPLRRK